MSNEQVLKEFRDLIQATNDTVMASANATLELGEYIKGFLSDYATIESVHYLIDGINTDQALERKTILGSAREQARDMLASHQGKFMNHEQIDIREQEILARMVRVEKHLMIGQTEQMGVPVGVQKDGTPVYLFPPSPSRIDRLQGELNHIAQDLGKISTHTANVLLSLTDQVECQSVALIGLLGERSIGWKAKARAAIERRTRRRSTWSS